MTDQQEDFDEFRVEFTWEQSSATVTFAGGLDISTTGDMRAIFSNVGIAGAPSITVDLTQATFLDSSVLGVLVAACRQIRESGGSFSVTCGPGRIRRTFEMSGLIDYLHVRAPE